MAKKKTTSTSEPQRLYLLDGMALIYRAYFALIRNPIRTTEGFNTSAIFGFPGIGTRGTGRP